MIRQLIKAEPKITIQRVCRLLELHVSSYYYTPEIRPEDEAIKKRMAKIFEESFHSYGKRRLAFDLKKESERFFRNLKTEYLNGLSFINHQSVVAAVERYIRFYNYKRLNSVIDYLTPVQKRQELLKVA